MWRLLRFLVGADVFISYARADAGVYADRLATRLKSERGVSVYLDQELSPVGRQLPAVLLRHLHLSRRLVVIVSDAALHSEALQNEVDAFARTPRPVIPIDVLEREQRPSWSGLAGAFWRREDLQTLQTATPSDAIVAEILDSIGADRQSARTRRAAWTAFGAVIVAVIASLAMIVAARNEALRQTAIAEATAIANEAETVTRRDPRRLQHAGVLSAESMRRFNNLGVRSLIADSAVRNVLSQLGHIERRIVFRQRAEEVAVSRDGRFVAASYKEKVELWDTRNGLLRILTIDGATCEAAADLQFSRDGSHLAATCANYEMNRGWAGVWRTADAKLLGPSIVTRESHPVCALSSDGRFFAIAAEPHVVTILHTVTGASVRQLREQDGLYRLEFSPSSRYLVIGEQALWDWQNEDVVMPPIARGWLQTRFSDDERFVSATENENAFVFSFPDGRQLWSAAGKVVGMDRQRVAIQRSEGGVDIHDLESKQLITKLDVAYPNVVMMRGDDFGVGGNEGAAIYSLVPEIEVVRLRARVGHTEGASAIAMLDDRTVVSADIVGALRWKPRTAEAVWADESMGLVDFSPDSQQVVRDEFSTDRSSRFEIRDAGTGKILQVTTVNGHAISLSFGGRGRVVIGTSNGDVLLWDRGSSTRRIVPRRSSGAQAVEVTRDGNVLAVAAENEVTVWSLEHERATPLGRILHDGPVTKLAFGRSNDEIVTACGDGRVRLWKIAAGVPTLLSTSKAVRFLPALAVLDGTFLLMADGDSIAIRDVHRLDTAPVESIDLVSRAINIVTADEGVFATADEHGSLRVWRRAAVTEEIARFEVIADEEPPVVLSPNGRWLVAIGRTAFEVRSLWPADLLPALCGQLTPYADDPHYRAACIAE
ncbi:MAG TPA: toll/interleukin-1 receptor domain-containing protein [Thermoanaerobaculia bacterium]|nr:toll/interleukin-1 receptor domain-containing protein [Thermoanaerobaculia bacterium]